MFINHSDEALIGFQSGPFQRILPESPKTLSTSLGLIRPQVVEALLEQMSLTQPRRSTQQFVKRHSGVATHVRQAGQQDELLSYPSGKGTFERFS